MKRNIHIYPSTFKFESRILKITQSIIDNQIADQVIIVAIPSPDLPTVQRIDENRSVYRPPCLGTNWKKGKLRSLLIFIQFFFITIIKFGRKSTSIINSHSIYDLPIAVIIKWLSGGILIYDTHELETESNGLSGVKQKLLKIIEKTSIRWVDFTFVVSDSIRDWYKKEYQINKIEVIRNIPKGQNTLVNKDLFRKHFDIGSSHEIYLYQGALLNGRSIPLLLGVFSQVEKTKHLVIMGYGEHEDLVRSFSSKYDNIHFLPAVPPSEVLDYTVSADVGISLIENICLSYYYSLPNKLFEYWKSDLPIIGSNFPEIAAFIDSNHAGWSIPVTEGDLKKLVDSLSMGDISRMKEQLARNKKEMSWEQESLRLVESYRKII